MRRWCDELECFLFSVEIWRLKLSVRLLRQILSYFVCIYTPQLADNKHDDDNTAGRPLPAAGPVPPKQLIARYRNVPAVLGWPQPGFVGGEYVRSVSVKVAAQSREAGVQGADVQVRHVELIGDGVSPPYTTAPGSASARARAPPLCPDSATGVSCCADMPRGHGPRRRASVPRVGRGGSRSGSGSEQTGEQQQQDQLSQLGMHPCPWRCR